MSGKYRMSLYKEEVNRQQCIKSSEPREKQTSCDIIAGMNREAETQKIITLLKDEQIDWGQPYEGKGYIVQIPEFDEDDFLEDNLASAEVDIMLQLSKNKGAKRIK
jgi:hypothetical protein